MLSEADEMNAALDLAETVFMEFEAPYFSKRGTDSFLNFLRGKRMRDMLKSGGMSVWGCFQNSLLVGMLALRDGEHISLAFVDGEFHRRGIGRKLYAEAEKHAISRGVIEMTVNASDYGIPFYKAMGFAPADMQTISDGIIFTPMKKRLHERRYSHIEM